MKVLLLQDVYKLGRAGDVKKVANGYGRNYLIPQGLAVLATPGAVKQAERIRVTADARRAELNQELGGVSELIEGKRLVFAVRASETGRLYGSVTTRMIADAAKENFNIDISHRQVDTQPLRNLGTYTIPVRLTMDLVPEITLILHREGESADQPAEEAAQTPQALEEAEAAGEATASEEAAAEAEEAPAEQAEEAVLELEDADEAAGEVDQPADEETADTGEATEAETA